MLKPEARRALKYLGNTQGAIFVTQIKEFIKSKNWEEIGYNVAAFLFLLFIGMLIRLLLAYYFRENYYRYPLEIIWNRNVIFYPNDINFAGYGDFQSYYFSWTKAWFEQDWYPFNDWQETVTHRDDPLYMYSYPPLFLYFLLIIWRPGMTNLWIAIPMIVTDAACAGMVFLILKEIIKGSKSNLFAFVGGIIMAFSPINIVYVGIYWLNTGPVTLFTLVALYFVIKKKWFQAFFWLAIAAMTKQNALFLTYPIFMIMVGEKVQQMKLKKAIFESISVGLVFVITCFFAAIPWIFITPIQVGAHMLYPGQMLMLNTTILEPTIRKAISFSWSLLQLGFGGIFLDIIAFLLNSMLLMIIAATAITIPIFWRSYKGKLDEIEFFEWISIYTIITHIFMPRGVYKFYSAYYMPILLIALIGTLLYYSEKIISSIFLMFIVICVFMGLSIWYLTIDRYFTPVLLALVCLIIGFLTGLRGSFKYLERKDHLKIPF